MGQRFQVFVCSTVSDAKGVRKYRPIAAFHSQWCYGSLAIRTAWRLLVAFRNPWNAQVAASELKGVGLDLHVPYIKDPNDAGDDAEPKKAEDDSEQQVCPFIASLVVTCFRLDETSGFSRRLHLLPPDLLPSNADNNDGALFVDISEPGNPKYCLASVTGLEGNERGIERKVALTAEQYVRCYYDDLAEENQPLHEEIMEALNHLKNAPLATLPALAATWPEDFAETLQQKIDEAKSAGDGEHASQLERESAVSRGQASESSADSSAPVSSLKDQSLRKVFASVLDRQTSTEESIAAIDALPESAFLPDSVPTIRAALSSVRTFNEASLALLKRLLKADLASIVDLAPWTTPREARMTEPEESDAAKAEPAKLVSPLSVDQLLALAPTLASRHTEALDISNHQQLNATQLHSLIEHIPSLERLIALHCPEVDIERYKLRTIHGVAIVLSGELFEALIVREMQEGIMWLTDLANHPPKGAPAAALTVLVASAPTFVGRSLWDEASKREYHVHGCELTSFTKAGVVAGLFWVVDQVFSRQGGYLESSSFDYRAGFNRLDGSVTKRRQWLTNMSTVESELLEMGRSLGCLPTSPCLPPERQVVIPRWDGWALTLDTNLNSGDWLGDVKKYREVKGDNTLYPPRYAFVRWDKRPATPDVDENGEKVEVWTKYPAEALSLREWLARMPGERGKVDEALVEAAEGMLAKHGVQLMKVEEVLEVGKSWDVEPLKAARPKISARALLGMPE